VANRTLGMGLGTLALAAAMTLAGTAAAGSPGVHDGFYLRLGAGLGYTVDSVESDAYLGGDIQGSVTGLTGVGEVAVGGALSPGLFLGGGIYAHWLPSPRADDAEWRNAALNLSAQFDVEFDSATLFLVGPFIDYYFDPREGLHLQGSLGMAFGALGQGEVNQSGVENFDDMSGMGFGFMAGIGHEWWVGDQWSLGVLGRFTLASFSSEDQNNVDWSHLAVSPAVLFTASMN
jgi:hypothetical protein